MIEYFTFLICTRNKAERFVLNVIAHDINCKEVKS